jgi:hypothetical protein
VQQPQASFSTTVAGESRDAEFTRRFFGIWLAPHLGPRLRQSLLGATFPRSAGPLMDLRAAHYGIRPSGGRAGS